MNWQKYGSREFNAQNKPTFPDKNKEGKRKSRRKKRSKFKSEVKVINETLSKSDSDKNEEVKKSSIEKGQKINMSERGTGTSIIHKVAKSNSNSRPGASGWSIIFCFLVIS